MNFAATFQQTVIKDEEDDIRDAITMRVLSEDIEEKYLDDINGPWNVTTDILEEIWYE